MSSSLGVKAKTVGLTGTMMDNRETALNAALKLHEGRVTSADELIAAATKIDKYLSRTDDGDSVEPRRPEVNYIQHFEPTATGDEAARIYTMFRGVADQRDHAVEIAGVIIAPCDPFGRTTL